jgi:hypothetical protein
MKLTGSVNIEHWALSDDWVDTLPLALDIYPASRPVLATGADGLPIYGGPPQRLDAGWAEPRLAILVDGGAGTARLRSAEDSRPGRWVGSWVPDRSGSWTITDAIAYLSGTETLAFTMLLNDELVVSLPDSILTIVINTT